MKVIIHYQEDISKTVNFTVSTLRNLKHLIDIYPDEDITGEIRPSARNNPELQDILLAIYDHKMAVWNKYRNILKNPPHEKFIQVLVKNGIELKYEFSMNVNKNANKPMWHGTRDEYVAIPVKDPNTIYSLTA